MCNMKLGPWITKDCDTCSAVIRYRGYKKPIAQCVDCKEGVTDFTRYIARMNPQRKIIQPTDVRDFDYFEDKKPKYVKKTKHNKDICLDCKQQIVYEDKPRIVLRRKLYCNDCIKARVLARARKRYAENAKKRTKTFVCLECKKEFDKIGTRKRCDDCNVIHLREYKRKQKQREAEVKKNVVE